MNKKELEKILPHRAPMLLLDEAILESETALGKYCVRGDEFFLQGHFPDDPIVPGAILCEILAQSACVLLCEKIPEGKKPMYTGINRARFRAPVYPGDTIETSCRLVRSKGSFYFAKGTVMVRGRLCAAAEFSIAII